MNDEEYSEMCRKAFPLQVRFAMAFGIEDFVLEEEDGWLLFSMDDLVEMNIEKKGAFMKAVDFYKFVNPSHKCCECGNGLLMCPSCAVKTDYVQRFDSYHKLFLVKIMLEQHGLIWTGEDWKCSELIII